MHLHIFQSNYYFYQISVLTIFDLDKNFDREKVYISRTVILDYAHKSQCNCRYIHYTLHILYLIKFVVFSLADCYLEAPFEY